MWPLLFRLSAEPSAAAFCRNLCRGNSRETTAVGLFDVTRFYVSRSWHLGTHAEENKRAGVPGRASRIPAGAADPGSAGRGSLALARGRCWRGSLGSVSARIGGDVRRGGSLAASRSPQWLSVAAGLRAWAGHAAQGSESACPKLLGNCEEAPSTNEGIRS